jgi:hypothetical protein
MLSGSLFVFLPVLLAAGELTPAPLPVDQVVANMIERDHERQAALHGYTAMRRYTLAIPGHHKQAEMLVSMSCGEDGSKKFEVVEESGWGTALKHVFPRLLEGEIDAARPDRRERSRITPENYKFEMTGVDHLRGHAAYVLAIEPRTPNKYLVRGRIWVGADTFAIMRVEGEPAKSPSFWIKSTHLVHDYDAPAGPFWFPILDKSVTEARFVGVTEMTIEYFSYAPNARPLSAAEESPGSVQ